jgi:hypothetical protein
METTKIILRIQYNPADFFEFPFEYSNSNYTISFDNGTAEVTFSKPLVNLPEDLQTEIIKRVDTILSGRMISKHEIYELGPTSISTHYLDGKITTSHKIQGKASILKLRAYAPDIVLKDSTGKIIRDTKAERQNEQKEFLNLIANASGKHPILDKLIGSYKSAISDPADELVHLYEIIDALKSHFRSKEKAIAKLNLSEKKWDRLFCLSNNEPLKEGRHRGSKQNLRQASDDELTEAREIAQNIIRAVFF